MRKNYQTADSFNYNLLKEFAKDNRKNPTKAESVLWIYLRDDALGVRFRRQYVVDNFIADFICLSHKLIIELDGGYHNLPDQVISDQQRTEILESLGYSVIRFTNEQVLFDTDNVLEIIKNNLNNI